MENRLSTSWIIEASILKKRYDKEKAFLIRELKNLKNGMLIINKISPNLLKVFYLLSPILFSQNRLYKEFSEHMRKLISNIEAQIRIYPFKSLRYYLGYMYQHFRALYTQWLDNQSIQQQLTLIENLGLIKIINLKLDELDISKYISNRGLNIEHILKSIKIQNIEISKTKFLKAKRDILRLYALELENERILQQKLIYIVSYFNQRVLSKSKLESKGKMPDFKWLCLAITHMATFFNIIKHPGFSHIININTYTTGSKI